MCILFRFETGDRLEVLYGVLEHHSADLADIRDLINTLVEASHKIVHHESFLQDMQEADSLSSRQRHLMHCSFLVCMPDETEWLKRPKTHLPG